MFLEGIQLGRYMLIKRIGGGGMGDVYLAEDPQIGQKVAIKVIKTEATLNIDTMVMQDFQEEARAIARLDHPHIMQLLSYSEEQVHGDTVAYIVMPYRKEGNLIQWLRQHHEKSEITAVERGRLIQQAAAALKYAHDRNIIHRDVKPSNFLVRENPDSPHQPDLLLSDFGLAKLMNATSSASQNVRGTPAYMAPEQWGGTAMAASDQYSLAIMAYELLTEHTPFQGNPLQMMHQHLSATPPAPSSFNPALPAGIDDVLLCALQKEPSARYASVASFADNLLKALNGLEYTTSTLTSNAESIEEGPTVADSHKLVLQAADSTILRGAESDTPDNLSDGGEELVSAPQTRTLYDEDTEPVEDETSTSQTRTLYDEDTEPVEEAESGVLYPVPPRPARPARPRLTKTKMLLSGLAAAIIISLIVGSLALALTNHKAAKNIASTDTQSLLTHGNGSATSQVSATATSKVHTTPGTTATNPKSNSGNGVTFPSPSVNYPTRQPTAHPTQQPTPYPTQQPTPVPTQQSTPNPTPTPNPTQPPPSPTPNPTQPPPPTPTPPPSSYPNIAGTYNGQIQNRSFSTWVTANMSITFTQNGGNLGGYCSIGSPLSGSGSLSGTISTGGSVHFTVYDTADGLNLYFSGSISGGYLQGSYTVSNGQYGVWIV